MSAGFQVTCPGCSSVFDATQTSCPICLRPRSREEVLAGLRGEAELPDRPPLIRRVYVLLLLCVAGACALWWKNGGRETFEAYCSPPVEAPVQPVDPPQPAAPAPTHAPASAPVPGWTVRGLVYDLVNLSPVKDARIILKDKSSERSFETKTGSDGRYEARVPKIKEGGYLLFVRHPVYGDRYLEERDMPYRSQSLEVRREALTSLNSMQILHVPILPPQKDESLEYDIVMWRSHR